MKGSWPLSPAKWDLGERDPVSFRPDASFPLCMEKNTCQLLGGKPQEEADRGLRVLTQLPWFPGSTCPITVWHCQQMPRGKATRNLLLHHQVSLRLDTSTSSTPQCSEWGWRWKVKLSATFICLLRVASHPIFIQNWLRQQMASSNNCWPHGFTPFNSLWHTNGGLSLWERAAACSSLRMPNYWPPRLRQRVHGDTESVSWAGAAHLHPPLCLARLQQAPSPALTWGHQSPGKSEERAWINEVIIRCFGQCLVKNWPTGKEYKVLVQAKVLQALGILQTACVCACMCLSSTTMAWFWVMHAEYAWSRRLVPCEPVDMWCACNWTAGQSVWLSKTHFWQPKRRLQSTFGLQLVFANRGLDNRHWNQPQFHSKPSFLKIPTRKSGACPLTCRSCSVVAFHDLPSTSWNEGSRVPPSVTLLSFQHNAPELWLICGGIKGLWVLPEQSQTQKSLYLLRGTCQKSLRKQCCRMMQVTATVFEECFWRNAFWWTVYLKALPVHIFFLTDSRSCKMLLE